MSGKQRQKEMARPSPIGPKTADDRDRVTAAVIGVDAAWREAEARWGVGRLPLLVSDATRLSMRRGMDQWQTAIRTGDVAAVERLAPLIRQALAVMTAEAERAGAAPLSAAVMEGRRDDGTVVAIVRSQAEASAVWQTGRAIEVWTVDEIVRVLPSVVSDIKRQFPGAHVERTTRHDDGYAMDWITADTARMDLMEDA